MNVLLVVAVGWGWGEATLELGVVKQVHCGTKDDTTCLVKQ